MTSLHPDTEALRGRLGFRNGPFSGNVGFSEVGARAGVFRNGDDESMTGKVLQDLVGRVMIDREFLADLVRDPDGVLAGYELTVDERAVIMQALGRGTHGSDQERALALQSVMLKRWAT